MDLARLIIAIEVKKREMYDADEKDRLRVSQELDVLIVKYHKMQCHAYVTPSHA